jgi:hypothetical protein
MNSDNLRIAIYEHLESLRPGSLSFWGNWFGKPYDHIHRIVGADSFEGTAVIYFDHAESLIIDIPRRWSFDGRQLVVREAERVRFQWFQYGRLPGPESLHFDEYRWVEGSLSFATDFQRARCANLDQNSPAVQLHALG